MTDLTTTTRPDWPAVRQFCAAGAWQRAYGAAWRARKETP